MEFYVSSKRGRSNKKNKLRAFNGDQAKISFRSIRFIEEAPEGGFRGGKGEGMVRDKKFLSTS